MITVGVGFHGAISSVQSFDPCCGDVSAILSKISTVDLSSQHGKLKQRRLIPRRIAAEKQRGQVTVTCLPLHHLPACPKQNDAECIYSQGEAKKLIKRLQYLSFSGMSSQLCE